MCDKCNKRVEFECGCHRVKEIPCGCKEPAVMNCGCKSITDFSCVTYTGADVPNLYIKKGDTGDIVIGKIDKAIDDFSIELSRNNISLQSISKSSDIYVGDVYGGIYEFRGIKAGDGLVVNEMDTDLEISISYGFVNVGNGISVMNEKGNTYKISKLNSDTLNIIKKDDDTISIEMKIDKFNSQSEAAKSGLTRGDLYFNLNDNKVKVIL